MVTKRKNRSTRVRALRRRKLDADREQKVRGGYIGETEKLRGASRGLPCDGASKDPA